MKHLLLFILCLFALTSCQKLGITPITPPLVVVHDTIPDGGVLAIQVAKDSINTDGCLLSFNHTAIANYKAGEDAPYFMGAGIVNIASLAGTTSIAINKLPYKANTSINLGVASRKDTILLIKVERIVNIPSSIEIWLKDAVTNDSLNIRKANYHFHMPYTGKGVFDNTRFSITFR